MSTPYTPDQPDHGQNQPTVPLQETRPYPQPYADAPAAPAAPQQPTHYAVQPQPIPEKTTVGETNAYALLSIIFAFIAPIAGIVFGHLGLGQIKRTGDGGRGIALTGLIISYAYFAFLALFIIAYVGFIIMLFGTMGAALSELGSYSSTY